MKRIFSLTLGLGAGLVVGAYVVRRLESASQAVQPTNVAHQVGAAAGTFAERWRAAVEETRLGAAEREAELRERFDVPGVRDSLGR